MSTQPVRRLDPALLRQFELFRSVEAADAEAIAKCFVMEGFPAGSRVFSEGDPGDKLYLIASGAVRITQPLAHGAEEALAVLHSGQFFGDMSLIDARPRSAHAIAHEDCVLYWIDRSVFITLLRMRSGLAVDVLFQFLLSLCTRLRENNDKIRAMNVMAMW